MAYVHVAGGVLHGVYIGVVLDGIVPEADDIQAVLDVDIDVERTVRIENVRVLPMGQMLGSVDI